ncbi:hypothetical protein EXIGLDRAFT_721702, partial [Exidia glandulosa HHB12029]
MEGFAKGLRLLALVRLGTLGVTVALLVHCLPVPIVEAGVEGVVPGAAASSEVARGGSVGRRGPERAAGDGENSNEEGECLGEH